MIQILFYILLILAFIQSFLGPSLRNYLRRIWIAFQLPGPTTTFPFGNCFTLRNPNVLKEEFAQGISKYGVFGRIWLLIFPVFVILDPRDIQMVLGTKKHSEKIFLYKFLHNFLGKGLITSNGQRWYMHRKYLQPYFHLGVLENFIQSYEKCMENVFLRETEGITEPFNITPLINRYVLSVLNETILGLRSDDKIQTQSPFRDGKLQVPDRIKYPWLLFQTIYNLTKASSNEISQKERLESFTKEMIKIRKMHRNRSTNTKPCMLDFMLEISEQNPNFTEQDIIDEACTMMLAGQDSTGSVLAFTIYYLAVHPEYQEKCVEEIDAVFKEKQTKSLTLKDLNEMRFLEMCIKETLRLHPSIIIFGRKLSEEVEVQGMTLPAGSDVFLIPYATHRNPEYYPNPEKFDPERFSIENTATRHKFSYIPFSAGPRNCIGYQFALIEIKVMLSMLLRKYRIIQIPNVTKLEPVFRITVRARGGIWIKLEPRT